jgi:hypothetical protein
MRNAPSALKLWTMMVAARCSSGRDARNAAIA